MIFSLPFSLKNNEENKRKIDRKILGKFYRAHVLSSPSISSLSPTSLVSSSTLAFSSASDRSSSATWPSGKRSPLWQHGSSPPYASPPCAKLRGGRIRFQKLWRSSNQAPMDEMNSSKQMVILFSKFSHLPLFFPCFSQQKTTVSA